MLLSALLALMASALIMDGLLSPNTGAIFAVIMMLAQRYSRIKSLYRIGWNSQTTSETQQGTGFIEKVEAVPAWLEFLAWALIVLTLLSM
jgi:hypothetical protein